jgi:hypothetical protein
MLVLVGLVLLFFARAGWWVVTNEIPSLDESAHYAYVQSLTEGHDPVTGQTTVGRDSILFEKDDPIDYFQSLALPAEPGPEWGISDGNDEAFQPPLYYLLSVPAYALGRPFGPLGALYALRVWTVVLVGLGIPLLYLAARELFPEQPAAWLLAPTVLTGVQMVVSNLSQVTNDAIMIPLGAAALWVLGRYFNRPTYLRAGVVGAVLGLSFLAPGAAGRVTPRARRRGCTAGRRTPRRPASTSSSIPTTRGSATAWPGTGRWSAPWPTARRRSSPPSPSARPGPAAGRARAARRRATPAAWRCG